MHKICLQTVHRFSKTFSCLGAETPSSGSLKNEGVPEPIYQSRNSMSNIEIFKILKLYNINS
jgi:hypothetical protein